MLIRRGEQAAERSSAEEVSEAFSRLYGGAVRIFRAPGRVNLIGEHTDYNDGFVMPAALQFYTYAAVGPRFERMLSVHSLEFGETREFDLEQLGSGPENHWSDYIRGVAAVLQSKGQRLRGANLVVKGEVPIGAGLSSSAAIEVATAFALLWNSDAVMERADIALACQRAEHQYAGTKCGIMDQFISCFGKAQHALLLDCRRLTYEYLPVDEGVRIVICNTNVKHELASGEYNRRRTECEAGVRHLRQYLPDIKALRDVTPPQLEQFAAGMPEIVYRRCRHVVTEDERALSAAEALKSGDLKRFGELMFASHHSLQRDYEVSCPELDAMVDIARGSSGVYGARMTGGGFGGCTVNLVEARRVEGFTVNIQREYEAATKLRADVYVCNASQGAGEVEAGAS